MVRPQTTVILAVSADGKIADKARSRSTFSSDNDQNHLEYQVSLADAVLFGAGTLRAYGTTRSVVDPQLKQARKQRQQTPQPVQIVVSARGSLDPEARFFRQPVPRWLLTTEEGAKLWDKSPEKFERILIADIKDDSFDWLDVFSQLQELGLQRLAILGGGQLVASLFELNLVDEMWLTVCPVIIGGESAPTPVEGEGFLSENALNLELLSVETKGQEIFLHYRCIRGEQE
jgi:5-amino-6-(5-phosphoribosylamino)uracil reductase